MDNDLQNKIDVLGLQAVDEAAYNKDLKPHEETYKRAKIDINRFENYKLYDGVHMLYSIEYIERTPIEELLNLIRLMLTIKRLIACRNLTY
ncbi:hydrolase [Bacillus toyonensis]|uniref:Hydrolase n=1 Tax=Bacillus toyonensis TaxID=155322 RepID=A0AAP8F148_9BACI|nr:MULTISPECIES: hydrolase [Bacillus]KAB2383207.1 hydrolase [Bacillus toyonensis]MCU4966260.1 hydrolase [Bacillus toyonensis]MCU5397614.1 hydrolase [Bacillus toyonensis]PDY49364.1 hydrolase [Bacillus toyonensis]PEB19851.1 hydrolase [Bacillus toyonensis]